MHNIGAPSFSVNQFLVPILKKELVELDIPEISGKADITVGTVKYKFKRYSINFAHSLEIVFNL